MQPFKNALKGVFLSLLTNVNCLTDLSGQESSAHVENVSVDKEAVDKLTEGLLSHYLPDLQNSKRTLQELT